MFTHHRCLLLVSPTGSGKTVIAAIIISFLLKNNKKVLFLAHRRELINQCSKKLDEIGIDHGIIMGNHPRKKPVCPVQIASVQTLTNRDKPCVDFIIIDEAHRSLSKSYQDIVNHYPDNVSILGLTATPWRGDGKEMGQFYNALYVVAQVQTLVDEEHLMDPSTYVPSQPDLSGLKLVGGDYVDKELDAVMNYDTLINHMVDYWLNNNKNKRTVFFACTVDHSKKIVDAFNKVDIRAEHIDHSTDTNERDAILKRLKSGKTTIVSNVGVLVEGWNLPELECVTLARPTKSLVLYLQMVGRVMRVLKGKLEAILVDHAGCVMEHGLVTDERDFSLTNAAKPLSYIPKLCPNCSRVVNVKSRLCPHCDCVLIVRSLNIKLTNNRQLYEACRERCVRCNSAKIKKCDLGLSYAITYQCSECGEYTLYGKYMSNFASDRKRRKEHKRLLKIQKFNEFHKDWARFKYMEIFKGWPEKTII